jgi:NAD+ synthetase
VVLGLGDYARKNGFTQAVIGLSGGVDSAVVAALACGALGPENVLGVTLPSVFSSRETRHDARQLADNLGMAFREIYIQPLVDQFKQALQEDFAGAAPDETEENLQARVRAVVLMAYSNKFRRLLLNTGNKSESSVGYCTLYGDMAGGFAPIKDIPKTLVFKLARFINEKQGRAVIPASIIARPPSAELKYDQKDSDSLPEYGVLDRVLYYHIEKHLDPPAIARRGLDLRTAADVAGKVRRSEYKRRQAPPGVKITPLALGKDRRMPISSFF